MLAKIGARIISRSSSQLWSLGRLNHVAIAVPDLDKATSFYRDILGAECSGKDDLPEHGVTTGIYYKNY